MTTGNNGKGKKLQLIHDASTIYYLHPSEGPNNQLTKYLLAGDNYDIWAKAVINALEGRNKFGFVNGDYTEPVDPKSPDYIAWKSNNSTICSWIFNSVAISIQPSIVSHKIATELWNDLKERYTIVNGPRINQLKFEYHLFPQHEQLIVNYYNKFKGLWDELYGSMDVTCGCVCVVAPKLRTRAAEEQVHDFVLGLNDDKYAALRTQILILSMDPFPTLNKAFSLATQEERHRSIVRGRDDKSEVMSFAVHASPSTPATSSASVASSQPIQCTYCGKQGHDYDRCYQRVAYPSGTSGGHGRGRSSRGSAPSTGRGQQPVASAHAAQGPRSDTAATPSSSSTASALPGLSSEQVQRLLSLLDSPSTTEKLTCKSPSTEPPWLFDSGASHHMTSTLNYLIERQELSPSLLLVSLMGFKLLPLCVALCIWVLWFSATFYTFLISNAILSLLVNLFVILTAW